MARSPLWAETQNPRKKKNLFLLSYAEIGHTVDMSTVSTVSTVWPCKQQARLLGRRRAEKVRGSP